MTLQTIYSCCSANAVAYFWVLICCNAQAAVVATENIDSVSRSEVQQLFEAGIQYTDEEIDARVQRIQAGFRTV